jgi:Flp pilus assembly protein TadG
MPRFFSGRRFVRCTGGAAAVEFAIVLAPFVFMLLGLLQMGVYYYAQISLDAGVLKTAEYLNTDFRTGSGTPVLPSAATLKTDVQSYGGSFNSASNLSVEIRQLTSLTAGLVSIVDGTVDYGGTTSILALRAQASLAIFAPGLGSLATVRSSALVRRQGR